MTNKVIKLWSALVDKLEPEVTLELESIEYNPFYGHEICVLRLVGKNSFPKLTTHEILSNPKLMTGLSRDDLVKITKLDIEINEKKKKHKIVEIDRNGSVVLQNSHGETTRYSEKIISSNPAIIGSLNPNDAHRIGYKVGFKDGLSTSDEKKKLKMTLKQKIVCLFPGIFIKK